MIYIGAEVIVSPLGETVAENWAALLANRTGIRSVAKTGFAGEDLFLSAFKEQSAENRFESLVVQVFDQLLSQTDADITTSPETIVIVSSTKGALEVNPFDQFGGTVSRLQNKFHLSHTPIVVSNACISGVLAINTAAAMISAGLYKHALVIGCDVLSDFIINGFQSLFAVSDQPCAPFDADRNGISLGEGCGGVIVSESKNIYKSPPLELLHGYTANDANHISGPSRTGEGLFRSVFKTLNAHKTSARDIDFVLAHGTATVFNDERESIAFDRSGLSDTPMNSLKGYFGHTLGAAGLIETAVSMQMIRHQTLIKSAGFRKPGTSRPLNIVSENRKTKISTILKTASGFGGGNASLIIRAL